MRPEIDVKAVADWIAKARKTPEGRAELERIKRVLPPNEPTDQEIAEFGGIRIVVNAGIPNGCAVMRSGDNEVWLTGLVEGSQLLTRTVHNFVSNKHSAGISV